MESTKTSAEKGLADFVSKQKKIKEPAILSFFRFDDEPEFVFSKSLQKVTKKELKLEPRGTTALFDAIGTAIDQTEDRLSNSKDKKRFINLKPKAEEQIKVIFIIVTDGGENASQKYTRDQIFNKIKSLRKKGWDFTFIGANQDAIQSGKQLGISAGQSLSYKASAIGTVGTYMALTSAVSDSRLTGQSLSYTPDHRAMAMGNIEPKEKGKAAKA